MASQSLSSAIAQFSFKFCNELDKSKSVVSSPLSAEILLALLTLGTTEPAHSELLTALSLSDDDAIRESFSSLTTKLKSAKGITLNVANKVYIKEGPYDLQSDIKNDAIKVFDADFEKVNFSAGQEAADLINKWVEDKTNNKIKELLSGNDLNEDTRLVLVNALYFKGSWTKKFDPANTIDRDFHVNNQKTVQVPMMFRSAEYKYGISQALGAQLLELEYEGGDAKMLIVLPNEVEGLESVLVKLAAGHDLIADTRTMIKTKVDVSVPKFKIETEIDLMPLLQKLGIQAIFSSHNSGLTRLMNKPEQLCVSKAVQKAFIEVNEEGAEAAAATGVGVLRLRASAPVINEFLADRPFQYSVWVRGAPFFVGAFHTYRGYNDPGDPSNLRSPDDSPRHSANRWCLHA